MRLWAYGDSRIGLLVKVTLKRLRSLTSCEISGDLGTPVPKDEQSRGFYYCNKCPKKLRDIGYFLTHMK